MQVELVNDGPVTIIRDTKQDKKTKPAGGFVITLPEGDVFVVKSG